MALYVGDTVVCINDSIDPSKADFIRRAYQQWIKKDEKYTVRELLENDGIVTGVLLNEVVNQPIFIPLVNAFQEPAFGEFRFRKLKHAESLVEQEVEVLEMV